MVNINDLSNSIVKEFFGQVDYAAHMRVSLSSHLINFFSIVKGFVPLEVIKKNEGSFSDFEENLSRATELYEYMREMPEISVMSYYHFNPDSGASNLVVEGYLHLLSIEERLYLFLDKLAESQFVSNFAKRHEGMFRDSLDVFNDITRLIAMTSIILKENQEKISEGAKIMPIPELVYNRLHSAAIRVNQANDNASKYSLANIVNKIQEYLPSDQDEDDDLDDSSEDLGSSETVKSGHSACTSDDSSEEVKA